MYENEDVHRFYGRHGAALYDLKDKRYFERYVDVMAVAPIIGFAYGRMSELDHADLDDPGRQAPATQISKVNHQLEIDYKLIMLLDDDYEPNFDERLKKAFIVEPLDRSPEDLEHFESYLRGGIDYLYENIIAEGNTLDNQLIELEDLLNSYSDRFCSMNE